MESAEARDPQTFAIIGAAMEVHRVLGHGFLEAVYQEALAHEFKLRGIPFEREKTLSVVFKGEILDVGYRVDFLCYGEILVELKSLQNLSGNEEAQLINYLKASGCQRGLLLNFGSPSLQQKRMVFHLRCSAKSADYFSLIITSAILKGRLAWSAWGRLAGMMTMSPDLARSFLLSIVMATSPSRIQTIAS